MITDIGREIERKRERDTKRGRQREKPHIEKERDL